MSTKDVLTLLLTFGMFILALIGIVIDLIKLSQKNNHHFALAQP
ncbi:putative holin-like toxin [Fructobacillus tropaeoli]|nr:putative holin-like toxin [Fructobacillus tropaeoli]